MYIMGVKGGTILLNQIVLVGRLANDPELYETETGKKVARVVLAVPRPYKNVEGEYESDFISCKLWQGIATSTTDYCKKETSLVSRDDFKHITMKQKKEKNT